MKKAKKAKVRKSSGNVFADLGLSDADELLGKSKLVYHITQLIKQRDLTQSEAAKVLGIDQPKISSLLRGRLDGFSTERLFRFLLALGQDIDIVLKEADRSDKPGELRVLAA